jgi:hypothetical protein
MMSKRKQSGVDKKQRSVSRSYNASHVTISRLSG